jgi:hypothetical protein
MLNPLLTDNAIFVFGSNLGGRHGAGAALYARQHCGATYGQGAGLQGNSYAIPTKDARLRPLPLSEIKIHVKRFLSYAAVCELRGTKWLFNVTPVGCELAGYTPKDIAPLFRVALMLSNVNLPTEFLEILEHD